MKAKLLSFERLYLWHISNITPIHHYEGAQAEGDMFYDDRPYLRDGIKVARSYIGGVGVQARFAIFYL